MYEGRTASESMSFVGVLDDEVLLHVQVISHIESCFKLLASLKGYRLISVKTLNNSEVFRIYRNDYKEVQLKVSAFYMIRA